MLASSSILVNLFKRLVAKDSLASGYIFFGESVKEKRIFVESLAHFLEGREFALSSQVLQEVLIVDGGAETIGIESARRIKRHLSERPLVGSRRVVIIDNAESLTLQAESALLKISEEPPAEGLIIMLIKNHEAILPTLASRFQKIYFPSPTHAKSLLVKDVLPLEHARKLSEASAETRKKIIKEYLDEERDPLVLTDAVIVALFFSSKKPAALIQKALQVRRELSSLNLNPRLQLESIFSK